MSSEAERQKRIDEALRRCASDHAGLPLDAGLYERWRTGLSEPFSVPTALAIAGTNAEFAAVCHRHGLEASAQPQPERPAMADDAPPTPPPTEAEVWNQQALTMALRRCAADLGEVPSQHGYESWRTNQDDPGLWPPGAVIAAKGWRWQLGLAGPRYGRPRRSDVEVWAHVRAIRDQLGSGVTRSQYEAFRGANPQLRLASASTIRVRTGKKWSELFGTP